MLIEIANGNLSYRLAIEGQDAIFDELVNMLNDVAQKLEDLEYKNPYNNKSTFDATNNPVAQIIQKVQDYILNHLEEPLPTTKELSIMFGINEFKLKENFRQILKTSIYQYYNDERLKKAHHLIQQTTIPLKEIAIISGFYDYPNFYKAFKKKFKYSPSDVHRIYLQKNTEI